jgi:hypothetical protein
VARLLRQPDTAVLTTSGFSAKKDLLAQLLALNQQVATEIEKGEWEARQETLAQAGELAADARELTAATDGRLTDHLATVLAARYAAALAGWDGEPTEEFRRKLRTLRGLCQDIVELRRGDHSGARLRMEQERLEREQAKTVEEVVAHFEHWAKNPAVRDWIQKDWQNPQEREARLRELFGLATAPPEEAAADTSPSNPVKPGQSESNPVKPSQTESNHIKPDEAANVH